MNALTGIQFLPSLCVVLNVYARLVVSQSWNCLNNLCILKSPEPRSWQDASVYCFQRFGGLPDYKQLQQIYEAVENWDPETPIWLGLRWIHGRLQWITHKPYEEKRLFRKDSFGDFLFDGLRVDPNMLCYYSKLNSEAKLLRNISCDQKLEFYCVKPESNSSVSWLLKETDDKIQLNGTISVPELVPWGKVKTHSTFLVVEPSTELRFSLSCVAHHNPESCLYEHIRWLKNGAYQPDVDNRTTISDTESNTLSGQTTWLLNWIGEVSCEIFCFSNGETYRSEKMVVVMPETIGLRIEFIQLRNGLVDTTIMQQYIQTKIEPTLRKKLINSTSDFIIEPAPLVTFPDNYLVAISFYAHVNSPKPLSLVEYIRRNIHDLNHWKKDSPEIMKFESVQVFVLNYCFEEGNRSELIFANQPTLARGLNSEYRYNLNNYSVCQFRSHQCRGDWFHPPKLELSPTQPLGCLRCMAPSVEHKGRCLELIVPKPFSKSIAHCLAEYRLDRVDELWDISDWIYLIFDGVEKNFQDFPSTLKQVWLPIQRRTNFGPLNRIWPWTLKEEEYLRDNPWLTDHNGTSMFQTILESNNLSINQSWLNGSQSCLTLDIRSRQIQSASCHQSFPMICIRPWLQMSNQSIGADLGRSFTIPGQCPLLWKTSTLFSERNRCYRMVKNETGLTFDQAVLECQNLGGKLATAWSSSTLAVILNLFSVDQLNENLDLWIGLKWSRSRYKWIDYSSWNYQRQADWADHEKKNSNIYGISIRFVNNPNASEPWSIKWRRWDKLDRLNGLVCNQMINPQREADISIKLDDNGYPRVSIRPVELHLNHPDRIIHTAEFSNSIETIPNPPTEVKFNVNYISCFVRDFVFISRYQSENVFVKFRMLSKIQPESDSTVSTLGDTEIWRGLEIGCETWDIWSTESLQTSWIVPDDFISPTLRHTRFIVQFLRHPSEPYRPEAHDSTFQTARALQTDLKRELIRVMGRNGELYGRVFADDVTHDIIEADDPIQLDLDSNGFLLVRYQLTFSLRNINRLSDNTNLLDRIKTFLSKRFESNTRTRFQFESVKSSEFCPAEITAMNGTFLANGERLERLEMNVKTELLWPVTATTTAVAPTSNCIGRDGHLLKRRCLGDRFSGRFWEPLQVGKDDSLCLEPTPVFQKLLDTTVMSNTSEILETVRQVLDETHKPSVAELELLAQSLLRGVDLNSNEPISENDVDQFLHIMQQISMSDSTSLFETQNSSPFSLHLAEAADKLFSRLVTPDRPITQPFQKSDPFIATVSSNRMEGDSASVVGLATNWNGINRSHLLFSNLTLEDIEQSDVAVHLPFQSSHKEQITFITYPDTKLVHASASAALYSPDSSQPGGSIKSDLSYTAVGGMIQVVMSSRPNRLTEPIKLFFRLKKNVSKADRHLLRCAFWDFRMNSGFGGWSVEGCWHEGSAHELELCRCNHLSSFTLLVSRSEEELQSTIHGSILNVITFVGCSLSILGIFILLATFVLFPSWRKGSSHKLVVQLSLALLILYLTFLGGVSQVDDENSCRVTGAVLHYSLLASFSWMTIEAYYQYLRFVQVFGTYRPRFVLKASILAWGLPWIPVASVLIYDIDSYAGSMDGSQDRTYCFFQNEGLIFYLAVMAPTIILLTVNFIVCVAVVKRIASVGRNLRTNQPKSKQAREKWIACFFNIVLLGLFWIFGFLSADATYSVVFHYLFCVTSTLQGFFLSVLYVGKDRNVRQLWLRRFGVVAQTRSPRRMNKSSDDLNTTQETFPMTTQTR